MEPILTKFCKDLMSIRIVIADPTKPQPGGAGITSNQLLVYEGESRPAIIRKEWRPSGDPTEILNLLNNHYREIIETPLLRLLTHKTAFWFSIEIWATIKNDVIMNCCIQDTTSNKHIYNISHKGITCIADIMNTVNEVLTASAS